MRCSRGDEEGGRDNFLGTPSTTLPGPFYYYSVGVVETKGREIAQRCNGITASSPPFLHKVRERTS